MSLGSRHPRSGWPGGRRGLCPRPLESAVTRLRGRCPQSAPALSHAQPSDGGWGLRSPAQPRGAG